jgi:SRSO17 transposase
MDEYELDTEAQRRLHNYFEVIGEVLNNVQRKASFAIYALGLIGQGNRKSMEPIAARACADPERTDAVHQRIQHFLVDSQWSDSEIRRASALYALEQMSKREPITHWIIDDTGFLKKGNHSVGVKRQYTGTAGKVTNCQVGVSLSVATTSEHLPIDFELYLPKEWTEDAARRHEARIPKDIIFQTKPELGLKMIRRALENGIPRGLVLVDTAYGNSSKFRRAVRQQGLDYAVAVSSTSKVWQVDSLERRISKPLTVSSLASKMVEEGDFRRYTWREGTSEKLSSLFARRRVLPIRDDGSNRGEREVLWLVMQWEDGESQPNKFYLCTLSQDISMKRLVYHIKQRWRTERAYQDLKGQLGLDHFEGRRYPGWHHHVSVALCCYAFIIAERARHFFSETGKSRRDDPERFAA